MRGARRRLARREVSPESLARPSVTVKKMEPPFPETVIPIALRGSGGCTVSASRLRILLTRSISPAEMERILALAPGAEVHATSSGEEALSLAEEADIICGFVGAEIAARAKRLRWVHTFSTGVDNLPYKELFERGAILTCSRGAHAVVLAEHSLMLMLMLAKRMPKFTRDQAGRRGDRVQMGTLQGRTLGILGFGAVGRELARKARPFDMRVVAAKRSPAFAEGVDRLIPMQEREELFRESDYVVCTLPLTDETIHVVGERELRAMKPTGFFINISRGRVVDEQALIRALKEGWIAGAGLDVVEQEPLPAESELYALQNVVITPHVAGWAEEALAKAFEIFLENLRRLVAGENMVNVVDRVAGY